MRRDAWFKRKIEKKRKWSEIIRKSLKDRIGAKTRKREILIIIRIILKNQEIIDWIEWIIRVYVCWK